MTPSRYENVFNKSRVDLYFNNRKELLNPYIGATSFLNSQNCSKIGLSLALAEWEYPLWVLLQNNKNNKQYEIRHFNIDNISATKYQTYPHRNFSPCAIISVDPSSKDTEVKKIKYLENTYSQQWSQGSVKVFTNAN